MSIEQIPSKIERVLTISAHPDDTEFFAGRTVAQLADNGAEVTLVVCTNGAKGGRNIKNVVTTRQREQGEAAGVLGINNVISLGYEDGELEASETLRNRLIEIIREIRPEIIFVHHPQTFYKFYGRTAYLGHSDHRAAGKSLMEAVYPRSGSPNFFPELGQPWSPGEIWLFDCETPNHRVDIGAAMDQKIAALSAHVSQQGVGAGLADAARRLGYYLGSDTQPAEVFVRLPLSGGG